MRLRIFFFFWGAPRGKCLLSRENNQYNIYKKIQRFAGTRRYASNKPSVWYTTRYNSFAWRCAEPNILLSRENDQYNIYNKIQRFAGIWSYFLISKCW